MKYLTRIVCFCFLIVFTAACGDLGYYSQSVGGHLSMMAKRQPITKIIADPGSSEELKKDLQLILEIRDFAENELFMPVGKSFSSYADIDRPYAVWNVVAAPIYSLAAKEWCFPITGCLPYRGYFNKAEAEQFADSLRGRGLEAHTYGVPAYSTLGWFDDPVLNTFIHYPEWALAGLIFHEMAHQMVYADSAGDFNEAFASTVEIEGIRRWLLARRSDADRKAYNRHKRREEAFFELLASTRKELLVCYDGRNTVVTEFRKICKEEAFTEMKQDYRDLKNSWAGYAGYDQWFEPGLNNARFISAQTYRQKVPVFMQLLQQNNGDLKAFYQAAQQLTELSADERQIIMTSLRKAAFAAIPETSAPASGLTQTESAKSGVQPSVH